MNSFWMFFGVILVVLIYMFFSGDLEIMLKKINEGVAKLNIIILGWQNRKKKD